MPATAIGPHELLADVESVTRELARLKANLRDDPEDASGEIEISLSDLERRVAAMRAVMEIGEAA